MPYINDETGKLNNFAKEPAMYQTESLGADQKRNYLVVGMVGSILVLGLIALAFVVS
jgi:hypothetical protein